MPFATKSYDAWAPYTQHFILGGGADGSAPLYAMKAPIGSLTSEAKWQIMKITYIGEGVTDIQWAGFTGKKGTDNFDKVADSYASYSYS